MKLLTRIFQLLLGVAALVLAALVAAVRLAWRTIRNGWKNRSKLFRRSIVTLFVVFPLGFVAIVAYALYKDEYGRDYYDKNLSENVSLHSFSDNKWRVYDERTDEYTTGKISWLSDVGEDDSIAVYALPHKRGYINVNTGRIIINAETNDYSKAWVFSEGLAAVMKDGKIGFVNAANEVVIPFKFDYVDKCRMWNFAYIFHNGFCAMNNADGELGLIDKAGNWVVQPSYDEIWAPHNSGYRIIVKDGKHGVLDSVASVVYPAEYGYVSILSDGFVLTKGGREWQVDFEGDTVESFLFDGTYYLKYPYGYDDNGELTFVFADYMKYEVMNCYGIMNRITGEPITPAIYSDINMLSKDLFEVQEFDSYDWYLLDTKGNKVSKK